MTDDTSNLNDDDFSNQTATGTGTSVVEALLKELADQTDHKAASSVSLEVSAVLGITYMKVSNLLKIGRGAVIMLDQVISDPIRVEINNKKIALADVVIIEDGLGISITEMIKQSPQPDI